MVVASSIIKKLIFFVKSQVEAGGDHDGLVRLSASPVRKEEEGDLVHAVELKIDGDTGWVFNFPYKIGRFRFFKNKIPESIEGGDLTITTRDRDTGEEILTKAKR